MEYSKNKLEFRLKNFPISFLAIVLGFVGFTLSIQKIEAFLSLSSIMSGAFINITISLFVIISSLYLVKFFLYFDEVIKEFNNPIKINFFPIFAVIFSIFSLIYLDINIVISKYCWLTGAILQLGFSFVILSIWMNHDKFHIKHINPSWFIPIVGSLIVPIAGVKYFPVDISWFFYSIGLVFWLILFILFMYRIIFHDPIEEKLIPTFFILFAPPAIAFISYIKLAGTLDAFAYILYYLSLFLFILTIFQFKRFLKINFYLSWWAYSFPLAAMTLATLTMFHISKILLFKYLTIIIFIFLAVMILILSLRTFLAVTRHELCVEE